MTTLLPRFAVRSRKSALIQLACEPDWPGSPHRVAQAESPVLIALASAGQVSDIARRNRQPMVGGGPGQAWRALEDVKPVHRCRGTAYAGIAPRGKRSRVFQAAGAPCQEVGLERDDYVGFFQVIDRLEIITECETRPCEDRIARYCLVRVPPGFGKLFEQAAELIGQRRRRHCLREDTQPGALPGAERFANAERKALKMLPGFDTSAAQ